jgi:hypothetical protein
MVERVTVNEGASPEKDEAQKQHDAAMAEKSGDTRFRVTEKDDGGETTQREFGGEPESKPSAEKPEWLPDKFWDAEKGEARYEDLSKSFSELEKQFHDSRRNEEPEENQAEDENEKAPEEQTPETQNAVQKAADEWAQKGELTDETIAELEKAGIPRQMVDTYVAGVEASQALFKEQANKITDGKLDDVLEWAGENLSEKEANSLNRMLEDPETYQTALTGLYARFQREANIEPGNTVGGTPASESGEYFKSAAEMTRAMGDPRYAQDSAFRAEVEKKVARALKRGVNLYA